MNPTPNTTPKLTPFAYQQEGIDWLVARSAAVLGDDAGLGKSMQMILAANIRGADRIIIFCPAIGRVSWRKQFDIWDDTNRPVYLYPSDTAALVPATGPAVLIVTQDWLSNPKNAADLKLVMSLADKFDAVFLDEIHFLKTASANRTKAIYGRALDRINSVTSNIPILWAASATLTPTHAGELYTHMRAILPDVLTDLFGKTPTQRSFEHRYCIVKDTGFGLKVEKNNPQTIPQLRDAFRPHYLARIKADVLKDLPPIQCVPLPLPLADKAARKAAVNLFFDSMPPERLTLDDDFNTLLGAALADPQYASKRRALGLLKVAPAVDWIKNHLSGSDTSSLVVFAHHRDVIDALTSKLSIFNPKVLHGGTTTADAVLAVECFQTDVACRVFIGQTKAAGTSITLTRAQDVLLVEPDGVNVTNYQAISRCHRIGQSGSVTAYFAYADETLDQRIASLAAQRARDQHQLFGNAQQGHT